MRCGDRVQDIDPSLAEERVGARLADVIRILLDERDELRGVESAAKLRIQIGREPRDVRRRGARSVRGDIAANVPAYPAAARSDDPAANLPPRGRRIAPTGRGAVDRMGAVIRVGG